jgi:hypothetical protein
MSDGLSIELELRVEKALEEVKELERAVEALGKRTDKDLRVDRFEKALKDAQKEMQALEAAAKKAAAESAKAFEEAAKKQEEKQNKAKSLFLQGVGGEELPEKVEKISRGFELAGDRSLTFGQRLQAGAGAAGIAATALGGLGGKLLQLGEKYLELEQAATQHVNTVALMGPAYDTMAQAARGAANAAELFAHKETVADAAISANAAQLGQLEGVAQRFAQTHGTTATQAVQRLVGAVAQGNAGELARFGVHLTQAELHAEGARGATERFTKTLQQLHEQAAVPMPREGLTGVLATAGDSFWKPVRDGIYGLVGPSQEARDALAAQAEAEAENEAAARRMTEAEERAATRASKHADEVHALADAQNVLRQALGDLPSAEETATAALQREADALRVVAERGQYAEQVWGDNANQFREVTDTIEAGRQAASSLATVQDLLTRSTQNLALARRDLNLELRQGETAQDATTRVMQTALRALPVQHEQTAMRGEVRRGLLAAARRSGGAFNAADIAALGFGPQGGGGGGNTEQLRRQIAELTSSAHKFGVEMEQFAPGRNEGLPHYLARLQRELVPAIEGAQHYAEALMDMAAAEHAAAEAASLAEASADYDARVAEYEQQISLERQLLEAGKARAAQHMAEEEQRARTIRSGVDGRDEEGRGLLRGLETSARTAGATNAAEDLYRDGDANVARARNLLEIRQLTTQAMRAEEAGNRGLADSLMAEAAARTQVVQTHDEQIRAMQRTAENALTFGGVMGTVWDSVTGAMQNHLAALVQGKEDAKTAFQGMAKDALQALSTRAIGEALANLAGGFANLAIQNYPGAAANFAAAALWGAVGVVSGVTSAAIPSPGAAAGKGASTAASAAPRAASVGGSDRGGERSPVNFTINVGGGGLSTKEDIGDHVVRALDEASRRGMLPEYARRAGN